MEKGIIIRNRFNSVLLDIGEVLYVLNEKRKVIVFTKDDFYWEYCSMNDLIDRVIDDRLYRCHHSLAVNLEQIRAIDESGVHLSDETLITMCRAALQQTKKAWSSYLAAVILAGNTGNKRSVLKQSAPLYFLKGRLR